MNILNESSLLISSHLMSIMVVGCIFFMMDLLCTNEKYRHMKIDVDFPNTMYGVVTLYLQAIPTICISLAIMCLCVHVFAISVDWDVVDTMTWTHIGINFIIIQALSALIVTGIHGVLHIKRLYWIHKTHHQYKYPVSIMAFYSSAIESWLNFIPLYFMYYVFPIPIILQCVFFMYANFSVMLGHSGFKVKHSYYHTYHHTKTIFNFAPSPFAWADKIMGTQFLGDH